MATATCGLWLAAAIAGVQPQARERDRAPAERPIELREFAPGVRIDWRQRQVEVDARVVLRKGPLELLACSPKTREHESVLAVGARPMHIFQAMGLIGLEPGSPARYEEKTDRWRPPHGEALDLRVRFRQGDKAHTVPVERWLLEVKTGRPPERVDWVFSGSRTLESGRFGAGLEGTVVCVVDFETALISVGSLHSADNELLWLEANTSAIPPPDTPCTLLIRSAKVRTITVTVTAAGEIRRAGALISTTELAETVGRVGAEHPAMRLVLQVGDDVTKATVEVVSTALIKAGVDPASIQIRRGVDNPGRPNLRNRPDGG